MAYISDNTAAAQDITTGSQHTAALFSSNLHDPIQPSFVSDSYPSTSLEGANITISTESDEGCSYPLFATPATHSSPISHVQQASGSSSSLELSSEPTLEPFPHYSFEDINPLFSSSSDLFPTIGQGRVSSPNPYTIFPDPAIQPSISYSEIRPTSLHTSHQTSPSRRQFLALGNFGNYPSMNVDDGHYPSTSSTSAAPENVQPNRYIDLIHGGVWFTETDPSTQAPHNHTRVPTEDKKRTRQLLPTLSGVEHMISYYRTGSRSHLSGDSTSDFHSYIREKEINYQRSIQMDLNREESSGVGPVEPLTKLVESDGGMANHPSRTKRRLASASRYAQRRNQSTAESDRCDSASVVKRPRRGSRIDPESTSPVTEVFRDKRRGKGRVAETSRAALRPQIKPVPPRCLADGFSQRRLVIKERPRHRKHGGEIGFQVIEAPGQP
ncbi:hypothetical protein JR316_0006594 [Psilocybe cubensis]|uniref:Uncharacterized protein n=2 Tax=Psilocybe cubensis TaxID=181762 RepID=A0ACB8GXA2_PSICU|nr:hypothetical protein JR316_0006594 [Psilocybe cubensis]KAH9479997.1 hypothetical protein JR316_0006594 [Psilocybe cubensis]